MSKQKMTPSEALVETLAAEGVKTVFGIVGSAFMDALDLFPAAGIRFVSVAHEQAAAHAADGLARVTGRPQVCIAQNGPGAANFVSAITAAYWAHSPVVAITPETGSMGIGTGGFQELDQMAWFRGADRLSGARQPAGAHGRTGPPGLLPGQSGERAGPAQYPPGLFLRIVRR